MPNLSYIVITLFFAPSPLQNQNWQNLHQTPFDIYLTFKGLIETYLFFHQRKTKTKPDIDKQFSICLET